MPTSGREWRKGVEFELPSGKIAEFRPLGFEQLILLDEIPDWLTAFVEEMFTEGFSESEIGLNIDEMLAKVTTSESDKIKKMHRLFASVARGMFLNPRIVTNPQADDEIGIDDVEFGDLAFVFGLFGKPQHELQRFSENQRKKRHLELVYPESDDAPRAESDTENRPMGSKSPRRKRVS